MIIIKRHLMIVCLINSVHNMEKHIFNIVFFKNLTCYLLVVATFKNVYVNMEVDYLFIKNKIKLCLITCYEVFFLLISLCAFLMLLCF